MASTSSIINPAQRKNDVFPSFRGPDCRHNFVCHLVKALRGKGILTFYDKNMGEGKYIPTGLLKAIEETKISVVIFTENYAYSEYCLEELQKIYDCRELQTILPVFLRIDPTVVVKLDGSYKSALDHHRERFEANIVDGWSNALIQIASISGFVSSDYDDDEGKLIEAIVQRILELLSEIGNQEYADGGLFGMKSRIKDVESLLHFESPDVRLLGIWGVAGIGKTTLAEKVFHQFSSQFVCKCMVLNVRVELEKSGCCSFQRQIIGQLSGKESSNVISPTDFSYIKNRIMGEKVFIVLDDVYNLEKLQFLVGPQFEYGPGSRIIITSTDRNILENVCAEIYEVKRLTEDEALQVFNFNALKKNPPTEAYKEWAKKAVKYAHSHPMAVKILARYLCNKPVEEWEIELEKLERNYHKDIESIWRLSFDELNDEEKEIFLDIAYFFNLEDKDHIERVLNSFGFYAKSGIRRLVEMALITILDKRLVMHSLIQQMGHHIVRQVGPKYPGERSRLRDAQDIYSVLKDDTRPHSVEGISLDVSRSREIELTSMAFVKMPRLRFLEVYSPDYPKVISYDQRKNRINDPRNGFRLLEMLEAGLNNIVTRYAVRLWNVVRGTTRNVMILVNPVTMLSNTEVNVRPPIDGFDFLPDDLRYIYWFGYKARTFASNFCPKNLVQLHLICSNVIELSFGDQCVENLKVMDLSFSIDLIRIPALSKFPRLEVLCLKGCSSLVQIQIGSSIEYHENLLHLDLGHCKNLYSYPSKFCFINLEFICLEGCPKIEEFPERSENLTQIILNGTALVQVPSCIGRCSGLAKLDLESCPDLKSIPSSICELKSLKRLNLKGCSGLMNLPNDICSLKSLVFFDIRSCPNLVTLPEDLGNLESLKYFYASYSGIKELPPSINRLSKLKQLFCDGCEDLIVPPFNDLRCLEYVSFAQCGMKIFEVTLKHCFPPQMFRNINGNPVQYSYTR